MMKQLQLAVLLSSLAVILLGAGLILGVVALQARAPAKKSRPEVPLPGPMVTISDEVYNLREADRFLKATIMFEVDVEDRSEKETKLFLDELQKRDPQIRDLVIREINKRSFRTINSPDGKKRLKEDLKEIINGVVALGKLKQVLFTSYAVQ